jgi:hypothetical protein
MGRVYGGDPNLLHYKDGTRANAGREIANFLDRHLRERNAHLGRRAVESALCPGCFMIAIYNAAVHLAEDNGQSLTELGNSLSKVFAELASGKRHTTEELDIILDPDHGIGDDCFA